MRGDTSRLLIDFQQLSENCLFFLTKTSRLWLGHLETKVEDKMYVLKGAAIPFISRSDLDVGLKLIGEAYIHVVMRGEAYDENTADQVICASCSKIKNQLL